MAERGLLPIGTVVLLKESTKRVMIVGICQKAVTSGNLYDYVGVVFPEGFVSSDKMFLFNKEQIKQIFAVGYQDMEQLEFLAKADQVIKQLREEEHNS